MTADQLEALGIDAKWLDPINETFDKYDISTPERQAAFIGQCQHESANFKILEENLHYKAESLMRVWANRFPTIEIANEYANNPEKIANKVYADRMGNGDEASGDGWNYHGRGLIQLTGKTNYGNCGSDLGVDFIGDPSRVADPEYAALSAGWFWNTHNLNEFADSKDYTTMTKRINGGTLGLDDRIAHINKALEVLNG